MGQFTVTFSNKAKTKMEEAYDLTGQKLVDAVIFDLKRMIGVKLNQARTDKVKTDFDFNE